MQNRLSLLTVSVALTPSIFLLLADLIIGDYELFTLINQKIANPVLDFACVYASPIFFSVFFVLALSALYFSGNSTSKAVGITSLINGPLSYSIGSLIKVLVGRPRPEVLSAARVISEARVIGLWHTSSFSFPSTTAMLAFGFAFPILFEKRKCGAILVALSYFMGFSVVYTGFHFPLDVAAGTLFSLAITFCTNRMKKTIVNLLKKYKPEKTENLEPA